MQRSQGGTTFGEHRNVTCEVGYTVTGLGGDERIQTIECMETGQFSSWKQCKQVSCGVPTRVISADIQVCADCEVHCNRSVPYTCSTGHTLDATPNGSNAFTARCESTGWFNGVENCTAIVCVAPPQSWKNGTLVEPGPVPTYGQKVSYNCLSGFSVNGTPSGDRGFEAQCLETSGFEFSGECRDIDWCLNTSTCGDHGVCVDGHLNYTCDCDAGFDAVSISNGEKCDEINECAGNGSCSTSTCNLINSFAVLVPLDTQLGK